MWLQCTPYLSTCRSRMGHVQWNRACPMSVPHRNWRVAHRFQEWQTWCSLSRDCSAPTWAANQLSASCHLFILATWPANQRSVKCHTLNWMTNSERIIMTLTKPQLDWKSSCAVLQTTFSNSFSWIKIVVFSFNIPLVQLTSISSGNDLAPDRRQAIIWTNYGQVYWRRYVSLGHSELNGTCVVVTLWEQGPGSISRTVFSQRLQFDRNLFCNNVTKTTIWTLLDADYYDQTILKGDRACIYRYFQNFHFGEIRICYFHSGLFFIYHNCFPFDSVQIV